MSLLDKLWDDTIAGPRPESGLGRLRKFNTFAGRSSSGKDSEGGNGRSAYGEEATMTAENQEVVRVTRSITILKPPGYNQTAGSAPASPAGSTPPVSPFSGSRSAPFRFRRRSISDTYEKTATEDGPRSPPSPYVV